MDQKREYLYTGLEVAFGVIFAAYTGYELYLNANGVSAFGGDPGLPVILGFSLFVIIVLWAIIRRQMHINEIHKGAPRIELVDFGFHTKEFNAPPVLVGYIIVANKPKAKSVLIDSNSKKVHAKIRWIDQDGFEADKNFGRWQIPNPNSIPPLERQTVDLDANGRAVELQFLKCVHNNVGTVFAFARTEDGYNHEFGLTNERYTIEIKLTDDKLVNRTFIVKLSRFDIDEYPGYGYRMIIDVDKGKREIRTYKLSDLEKAVKDYEPPQANIIGLTND